ncbi:hypothetical protein BN1723_001828 [Verticillium longisporum]|uniref:Citrate transporter-like domain-containing protein n=1 Tax=Verticillium longisporum TaxID=100787 RepID=A0A0G4KS19_VERLO|nr:hypothetical protein BN1723_001828 [Verticillium longisporum]
MVSWFEGPVRLAQDLRAKKQTRTFCRCQLSGTWQPDQWPDGIRVEGRAVRFPMNFVTAPIIADLFLLAIGAIGGKEVRQGTLGANNISPLDIMLFFITLAYIAISIDASGLIRFLAFKVLQWGGNNGRRLYLYLYMFFFGLTTFIGNDPVILSGTAFLAYMTRVSKDLSSPRAWIFSQFAAANIGSAILVSSNPTNLVLAGAFGIKFIHYTANMVVPTVITALVLYPILLYLIFTEPGLIARRMTMYQLPSHLSNVPPANPNIPAAKDLAVTELSHRAPRGAGQTASAQDGDSSRDLLALEEVLNPFLDTKSAIVGSVIMATTLITLLALNAASTGTGEHPVFWVTLPAAFLMFCWDVGCGWESRHTTREIAEFGDKKRLQALAVQQANPALTVTTSSEHVGRQTTVNPSDEKESQPASADGQLVTRPESIVLTIHEATQCPARANEQGTCDPGIEILGNAPHVSHAEPSPASLDTFGSEDFKAENMDKRAGSD